MDRTARGDSAPGLTLDAIAADPDLVKGLPRARLFGLILKAQALQMICADAMVDDDEPADEVLDVRAAAQALGMSRGSLYKLADTALKGLRVDNGTRNLRFSRARIDAYLRRDVRRDAGSAAPIASGARGASRVRALIEPSARSPRERREESPDEESRPDVSARTPMVDRLLRA
jgi:hypothetical protein